jgi:sugar lactone lactonase YvrE
MRKKILNLSLRQFHTKVSGLAALGLLLLSGGDLYAQATVTTLGGGSVSAPYSGFVNGNTLTTAKFSMPAGMALDASGNLYIADYTNNAVRLVSAAGNTASSTTTTWATNGVSRPLAVVLNGSGDVYVLNHGTGNNGAVLHFTGAGGTAVAQPTLASSLVNATAMTIDGANNLYVTVNGNKVIRVSQTGVVTNVGTISSSGTSLQGIVMLDSGKLALTDSGNNGIWIMNPVDGTSTNFTGFHGTGDVLGSSGVAAFNSPETIAEAGGGILVVADRGNNKVKLVSTTGTVSLLYGVSSNLWVTGSGKYPGWADGAAGAAKGNAESRLPYGVAVAADGGVFVDEDYYDILRHVTGTGLTAPPPPGTPGTGGGGSVPTGSFGGVAGIAYDSIDNFLFIANTTNNAVLLLNLNVTTNATSTFVGSADQVTNPVAVLLDTDDNVYVLNQGTKATNGYILEFDIYGNSYGPIVTGLTRPTAFTLDDFGNLFVTEQSSNIFAFGINVSNIVGTVTNAQVSLQGIALFDDGNLAMSDAGNQVIWTFNPLTKEVAKLTGRLGVSGTAVGVTNFAEFNQPHQLVRIGGDQIIGADTGNNRLVLISRAGTVTTNHFNSVVGAKLWFGNNVTDPVISTNTTFVPMLAPFGVAVDNNGDVFDSETVYTDVREMTGTTLTPPPSSPGVPLPVYSSPAGIALNNEGTFLFVADPTNNTISELDLANNQTTVFLDSGSGIYQPVDVGSDSSDNIYVLNQGTGGNGSIFEFDTYGNFLGTLASSLAMPTAMKLTFDGDILVTELNGVVQDFNSTGSNTLATITTNANVQLQGVAVLDNGSTIVSDSGNQVLWQILPGATNATLFTGMLGNPGTNFGAVGFAKLNKPRHLAEVYGGLLLVADSGNNRLVVANDLGTISSALRSTNADIWFGLPSDPVTPGSAEFVPMVSPVGLAIGLGTNATVYSSESFYKDIRGILNTGLRAPVPPPPAPLDLLAVATYGQVALSWTASPGATNYYVERSPSSGGPYTIIGSTTTTSYIDAGLTDGTTWYYVVVAVNVGGHSADSSEVSATLPFTAVADPQIGYVTFPPPFPYYSLFTPVSGSVTLNNDVDIVIEGTVGAQTFYNSSNTTALASVPDPTSSSASAPVGYQDGELSGTVAGQIVAGIMPSLSIKAIAEETNHPNSAVVSAQFLFVTGNPNIIGDNAAGFTIGDITAGAHLYYTLDGSEPSKTNSSAVDLGTLSGSNTVWTVSFAITTNTLFMVQAYKNNYQPSAIVSNLFTTAAYRPTAISFGTSGGQPHSSFIARPGQFYYAPVTLQLSPNFGKMYSLQFNATVTNGFTNILNGNPIQPIVNGAGINFFTMLMTEVSPTEGQYYPPADGNWYLPLPPLSEEVALGATNFSQTMFVNTNNNLLGVGWLYRTGFKYLYEDSIGDILLDFDTTKQDLIAYSIAHDTLFAQGNGLVVLGAYSFQIPSNAVAGDQYFIQLGSPSATADGVGAPGAGIYIEPPPLSQAVTVGAPSYIVGDAAPFNWLNAGDFGDTNLDNSDVMQVYQSGVLGVNLPPANSDLYAAMDSSGGYGTYDVANGYYTNSGPINVIMQQAMWDGNDLTINSNAFGDGYLDINDVYVTFRRSLDPSLLWFKRYWTNGMFVAVTNANYAFNSNTPHLLLSKPAQVQSKLSSSSSPSYLNSFVTFSAGDAISGAGSVVEIPITANIVGSDPIRVLGLNITVHPLDGSPTISNAVSFVQTSQLGTPDVPAGSQFPANFNAAWLNAGISGLSNNATLGTLGVQLPSTATSSSAYAVRFEFASGSPNGLAVFPKTTYTGLITTTARTNSIYGDGIPDSWRLRWFGTVNNLLSASNACPSGDGVPNWKKYIAGVDPNIPNDFPSTTPKTPIPAGSTTAITWPSVLNKQYVIMRATSLFNGPWTILSTNTGTGGVMEYDDSSTANVKFYRVEILP